jgi:hypothetical protein
MICSSAAHAQPRERHRAHHYIDGVVDRSDTDNGATLRARNLPLRIGTDGPGWNSVAEFNGTIDDVRIYNRALSATEVQALYHLGTVTIKPQ